MPVATNRATPTSRSAWPNISRKATRIAASAQGSGTARLATVNKETHGGKKSGSGRGQKRSYSASRKRPHRGPRAARRGEPTGGSALALAQKARDPQAGAAR